MNINDFVKWYENTYSSGDMNASVMRERAAVLYGYAAAIDKPSDSESGGPISAAQLLRECANSLRGAANVMETMRRKADA